MTAIDGFATSVESTLGIADEPTAELRDRVTNALRYTLSWLGALTPGALGALDVVAGNTDPVELIAFRGRITDMQTALRGLLDMLPLSDVFAGKDAKAAYERVSQGFAQLYRDLALSRSTLPRPELLEQLGDLGAGIFRAPAAAITTVAEEAAGAIAKALGGTAGALWSNLWPWLLVAGGVGLVYVFRAPLGRALGKVAA